MKSYKYISPEIVVKSLIESYSLLEASGDMDPGEIGAKETSFEEEETGIPDGFTNVWGDEEEKED